MGAEASGAPAGAPLIAYVVNHAAFFVSHRLPLALEARRRGYRVALATGQAGSETMEPAAECELAKQEIGHRRVSFTSSGTNPLTEMRGLWQLTRHLRRLRPALVHCASPKGNLYGGIAARLAGVPAVVFAVSGMGFAFTQSGNRGIARSIIANIYRRLARLAYGHPRKRVIVQNEDDRRLILDAGLARPDEVLLVPGSGVDVARFAVAKPKQAMVLFPARMLIDKGVLEFIEAVRILRPRAADWRFVMAGAADYRNPSSVSREQLERLVAEGLVEWSGHVADLSPFFDAASIVCLPSYREGMPKALLEAAAAGCAVVTTDVPGCREAVLPGVSGTLVPPRQATPLAEALWALMQDRERRDSYGRAGRKLARERFALEVIVRRITDLYEVLLKNG
jgi:glycosyltransferase involved in cell wall biosynthesis